MKSENIARKVATATLPENLLERFREIGCIDEVKQFGEASVKAGMREVIDSMLMRGEAEVVIMEENIKDKSLLVIEFLTMGDFIPTEKLLETIYRYAHVARGHCKNPHKDWEKELCEMYDKIK